MDNHVDTRGFLEIHAWIRYGFSDQDYNVLSNFLDKYLNRFNCISGTKMANKSAADLESDPMEVVYGEAVTELLQALKEAGPRASSVINFLFKGFSSGSESNIGYFHLTIA